MIELDPRQIKFLEQFTDPKSATFGNALQSALRAGYAQEYAENITHLMPDWLSENIGDLKLLKKAERNLDEFLDEPKDKKVKADITKFVAERLGKKKYSSKQEIEHSGSLSISKVLDQLEDGQKITE